MKVEISMAKGDSAEAIATLAVALFEEITVRTGAEHFEIDLQQTIDRCRRYLESEIYRVIVAKQAGVVVGFAALCESHALYTQGCFGIVQECYVSPSVRSEGVGQLIIAAAQSLAKQLGWRRLELCTPPLPEFDRSLTFYQELGFDVTGGRKMKWSVPVSD